MSKCGEDGGYEVDGWVWGDKDGEDVILEGDDSGVVSMVRNGRMSNPEYPLEALFILLNSFYVSVGVGKGEELIPSNLQAEMSSNEAQNKYLDLPIYGSSDSPDSILICAQSSSLPKLFYRRSIKGWAFSEGILDVTCS
ncbi:hypothetical protein Tco_1507667 [Tanacetum coccineum]